MGSQCRNSTISSRHIQLCHFIVGGKAVRLSQYLLLGICQISAQIHCLVLTCLIQIRQCSTIDTAAVCQRKLLALCHISDRTEFNICFIDRISLGIKNICQFYRILSFCCCRLHGKLCRIGVTSVIKEADADNLTCFRADGSIILIHNTGNVCLCGSLRWIFHIIGAHDTKRAHRISDDLSVIHTPALYGITVRAHSQIALTVYIERSVPCKEIG